MDIPGFVQICLRELERILKEEKAAAKLAEAEAKVTNG